MSILNESAEGTAPEINDPSRLSVSQRLRFLAKDSVLYGGAAAFNKAFALITFPLLARHFSVEAYGTIDFFNVLAALLMVLFVFGQDAAVARFFYDHDEREKRRNVISQSLGFQLFLLLALIPAAWLTAGAIANRLSSAPEARTLLRIVLMQVPFLLLINFSQNILKWTFSRSRFLFISIGSTMVSVLALLVAAVTFELTVVHVLAIYLCTQALFGLIGLFFVRHWLKPPESWAFLPAMLKFAVPYGVICTIAAAVPALERTLIIEFLGERELGLFAAGAKVAMLIALPIRAFQVAWGPFSLAIFKQHDAAQTYNWVLKGFSVLIFATVLGLTALADPVIHFLASNRYAGASVVVFALSFGVGMEAIGWITSIGIGLSKRSYLTLPSYMTFLTVSAIAIFSLMEAFGLPGVAWGVMTGYLAKTIVESWLAQRAYPLPWAYHGVAGLGLLTLIVGAASNIVRASVSAGAASAIAASGVLLIITWGWMLVLKTDERAAIVRTIGRFFERRRV